MLMLNKCLPATCNVIDSGGLKHCAALVNPVPSFDFPVGHSMHVMAVPVIPVLYDPLSQTHWKPVELNERLMEVLITFLHILHISVFTSQVEIATGTMLRISNNGVGIFARYNFVEDKELKMLPEPPNAVFDKKMTSFRIAWLVPSIRRAPP